MARYKALRKGVINVTTITQRPSGKVERDIHPLVINEGEEFDYQGKPGSWMELVEPAKRMVVEAPIPAAVETVKIGGAPARGQGGHPAKAGGAKGPDPEE